MFEKNKKSVGNTYDSRYESMWNVLMANKRGLAEKVEKTYIQNICINLYPEGPDKEKAIKDSNNAKHSLLCAIGSYDCAKMELENFYKENREKFEKCINWDPKQVIDSHKLIEICIKNLIKGV